MSRAFFSSDEVCSHGCGEEDGGRGRQEQEWDILRYELWQEHLDEGTESRFKPDMLFESCKATGLQSAESLLWPVPQMQLRSYSSNISKLACPYGCKECGANLPHPPFVVSAAPVAVAALQISLTERLEPWCAGAELGRGQDRQQPCSSACGAVPGGPGWDLGSHCAKNNAQLTCKAAAR